MTETLLTTPLHPLHRRLGARLVAFAGYAMPVQYPSGILAEHAQCRTSAALFDVSHMGQAVLEGAGAAAALERLTPADVQGLRPGRQRYALLTSEEGGILDDVMVANLGGDRLFLVVNAACKEADFARIGAALPAGVRLAVRSDRALLALQGPAAEAALVRAGAVEAASLPFMGAGEMTAAGVPCLVSRSGYTGEDGFEISVAAEDAERLALALLDDRGVAPAGLGARDSLRLEAGLCLYGNDIDRTTSPVEAGLAWTIGKRRRLDWDFPGAERIRRDLDDGPSRLRVGLLPEGRAPVRAHATIHAADGTPVGEVTSGGFGPTLNAPA
ncbi:MAG: glycine cleavage system aminomethyltransferase GcvT, partial [Acetobacteraceae bacterium]